ncbi:reverse transcriptase domain-containing protein [Tanacetum coccineum]
MAPKRATRSTPVTTTPAPTATTTTSVTNAQLQAMIDQGVTAALAARDANRNGDDSHTSGMGGRRTERITIALWKIRLKKMTDKYCPRNEMKKLEAELWNLKVKGVYKIERYVGGLPDMIHGNIVALKPKTMQEAVEMATELMDKKVSAIAKRQVENKRKFENTSRNNQTNKQQNKRRNTGHGPYMRGREWSAGNSNNANNQRGTGSGQKPTCFECGVQGHFRRTMPNAEDTTKNVYKVLFENDMALA